MTNLTRTGPTLWLSSTQSSRSRSFIISHCSQSVPIQIKHIFREQSPKYFQDSINTKPSGFLVGCFLSGLARRGGAVTVQRELNQKSGGRMEKRKRLNLGTICLLFGTMKTRLWLFFDEWVICAACDLAIVCDTLVTTVELPQLEENPCSLKGSWVVL